VVISDVVMPDGNGLEMLPKIAAGPARPAGDRDFGAEHDHDRDQAEAEAYDYLPKPFDLPDLMKRTARALETKRRAPWARSPAEVRGPADELPLVGRTPAMQALYRLVARVMNTDLPVLITGESGTGKVPDRPGDSRFFRPAHLPFVWCHAAICRSGRPRQGHGAGARRHAGVRRGRRSRPGDRAGPRCAHDGCARRQCAALHGHQPGRLADGLEAGLFRQDLYLPALGRRDVDVPACASGSTTFRCWPSISWPAPNVRAAHTPPV
jgi:two-component system nitrogen regulation response regulator GlnG